MQRAEVDITMTVRSFVQENFLYMRPNFELTNDDRLLEQGVVDSMGIAELIAFVETEFGVSVSDDEISDENFGSLRSIGRFIERKKFLVDAA